MVAVRIPGRWEGEGEGEMGERKVWLVRQLVRPLL